MISSVRRQTGELEPIKVALRDQGGVPLPGKTDILVRVYRKSDGYYLDWNDYAFKNAGWTTFDAAMSEVDATSLKGVYLKDFDTFLISNPVADDTYVVSISQSPGTDAVGLPVEAEIKVGQWVDNLDVAISTRAEPGDQMTITAGERLQIVQDVWDELLSGHTTAGSAGDELSLVRKLLTNRLLLTDGSSGNWTLYDDDSVTPILTWDVSDVNGGAIVNDPGIPARRTKGV